MTTQPTKPKRKRQIRRRYHGSTYHPVERYTFEPCSTIGCFQLHVPQATGDTRCPECLAKGGAGMARLLLVPCLALLALACAADVDPPAPEATPIPEECVLYDSTDLCPNPTAKSDLYYCGPPGVERYMLLVIHDGEGTTLEWPASPDWNLTALEARRALCRDGVS